MQTTEKRETFDAALRLLRALKFTDLDARRFCENAVTKLEVLDPDEVWKEPKARKDTDALLARLRHLGHREVAAVLNKEISPIFS